MKSHDASDGHKFPVSWLFFVLLTRKKSEPSAEGLQWPSIPRVPSQFSAMRKNAVPAAVQEKLLRSAQQVMKNAHAPYSKFRVGAAILLKNGEIFSGCNVENASYGMTNCAERTAIFSAVAQLGPEIEIRAVTVVNDHRVPCSPCGACRQVIYEFGPDATIFFQSTKGPKQAHITELLPEGFRLQ
jgi:cytidine deaminase